MHRHVHPWHRAIALPSVLLLGLTSGALAARDETDRSTVSGELEYRINCASCHGLDAKGAGPMADALTAVPPDLTVLAKRNDGVFPFMRVIETIDGRTDVIAHGSREMPVWGARFRTNLNGAVARARILDLTLYLRSIQID